MKALRLPFLLLMISLLFTSPAKSQWLLGVKGGINISSISTDAGYKKNGNQNAILGHAGIMLEGTLSDHFAIQPGVNWLQKGWKNETAAFEKWVFNILDIHVLAKYKYNIGSVKGFIDAGPTFGPVLSASKTPKGGDAENVDLDADKIEKFDYGITAGLGFGLALGKGTLFVDGRYMISFNDAFKEEANKGKVQKVGFDYCLGYLFPL
jgi:hypothetical protein